MLCLVMSIALPAVACLHETVTKENPEIKIELTSASFKDGEAIPAKHTCDGEDSSPALKWTGLPNKAKSLALICDDPDAPIGTWVHWVLYDLPPTLSALSEAIPSSESIPEGARQGTNDFKRIGYGGPCPPPGNPHRYFFKLYALDTRLDLKPGAPKVDLEIAMKGHILAQGQLMGTYKRR
jgi:Raf kinase inhibitor-like YbhB/YbcL family protein